MPDGFKPYYFGTTTGAVPTLMLGVYPGDSSDTGLTAAAKKIVIENKAMVWEADGYLNKVPTAPTMASGIAVQLGAKTLAASATAAALVAAALY